MDSSVQRIALVLTWIAVVTTTTTPYCAAFRFVAKTRGLHRRAPSPPRVSASPSWTYRQRTTPLIHTLDEAFRQSSSSSHIRLHDTASSGNNNDASTSVELETEEEEPQARGGILKILFISVPLFFKFCIVLLVKFLTDLVVYPLLLLYRLARLTKQRILSLFDRNNNERSNGA